MEEMDNKRGKGGIWLLAAIVALLIIVPFVIWGDAVTEWFNVQIEAAQGRRGAAALVMFGLLASDIVIPVPSSLVSTCCGMILGFTRGFLVSFFAMCVSAAAGYLLGRFCSGYARRMVGERDMAALARFQERNSGWWLLLLRPVPVLAEASVIFSGIGREPPGVAAVWVLLGNAVVSAVYAAVGAWSGSSESMLPAFAGTLAVTGLLMLIGRRKTRIPGVGG